MFYKLQLNVFSAVFVSLRKSKVQFSLPAKCRNLALTLMVGCELTALGSIIIKDM